jgi:hypothetical protein
MVAKFLNAFTAAVCVPAFIFLIIGCTGFSSRHSFIQDVPWIYFGNDDDYFPITYYFGLQKLYATLDGSFNIDSLVPYDSSKCGLNSCNECETDGKTSFGMLVVASVFCFATLSITLYSLVKFNPSLQYASWISALISFIFSFIGFGIFMDKCFHSLDRETTLDVHYGAGSIITVTGAAFMCLASTLQMIAVVYLATGKEDTLVASVQM